MTMQRYIFPFILPILALACNGKGASNDTQIGDDDGGYAETGGFDEPAPVVDHGVADFCVDRATYWSTHGLPWDPENPDYDLFEVQANELWYQAENQSWSTIDVSRKPNPMGLSGTYCPEGNWPLVHDYAIDKDGATCMNSGYHIQAPIPILDLMPPGPVTLPYSVDIVTQSLFPGYAMRHTWAGPGCCQLPATPDQISDDAYAYAASKVNGLDAARTFNIDCLSYVTATGINNNELGFPVIGNGDFALESAAWRARCVSHEGDYTPARAAVRTLLRVGKTIKEDYGYSYTTWQYPFVFNYDWIETIATFADWDELIVQLAQYTGVAAVFAKFGVTQAALVQATWWVINTLWLPPGDFVHPRYGLGGGCSFRWWVQWSEQLAWRANFTCPRGFYGDIDEIDLSDTAAGIAGYHGTCDADGIDAAPLENSFGVLSPSPTGRGRTFVVSDIEAFGALLDAAVAAGGTIDYALADAINSAIDERAALYTANGLDAPANPPSVNVGDVIAWSSSPDGIPTSTPSEALRRSLGYDDIALRELADALGWTLADARTWIDTRGIGTVEQALGEQAAAVPEHLLQRTTVSLREHHAWHMRVESDVDGDGVADRLIGLHFIR